jgi:plasmid stability protein
MSRQFFMKEINMTNLTIHNLDESLTNNLRIHAQQHGQTVEEEARQILSLAFAERSQKTSGLGSRISKRFTEIGGVELPQPARSLPRQPVNFGETN